MDKMTRKGLSQNALTLILGIFLMLFVLMINTAFAPTESFKEFLKKVPFLNKIVPEPGKDNPQPGTFNGKCGDVCTDSATPCLPTQICRNNRCENNDQCKDVDVGL